MLLNYIVISEWLVSICSIKLQSIIIIDVIYYNTVYNVGTYKDKILASQ